MNEHIQRFNEKLIGIFECKAAEFSKHSEEHPVTSSVTSELAGLYSDLAEVMRQ